MNQHNPKSGIVDFLIGFFGTWLMYICDHIDVILTRSIGVLTIIILMIRLYRLFFPKPVTKQIENEDEI